MKHETEQTETTALAPVPEGNVEGFSFGRNWHEFLRKNLTPQRERQAELSVTDFLQLNRLDGMSFLDIGCGSGLFSQAAQRLGASKIVSIDVDPYSVGCCKFLRERNGSPASWQVLHGSVLDAALMETLELADIVYAWGSLHHTGNMWQAIRNAAGRVKPGGLFYVTIYNTVGGWTSSQFWLKTKKYYNEASIPMRRLMEGVYILRYAIVPNLLRFRNPFRYMREHSQNRGMDYLVDVKDWLGGYPYEFATAGEIFRFVHQELGFSLENLSTQNELGTNDFLFRRDKE